MLKVESLVWVACEVALPSAWGL